jgi:putative FmdB family regulatory protein
MPFYEYRCENGHTFEVMQKMADDPIQVCEVCGASVQRVFHPVAVHFKGSGFYNTDYGKQRRGGAGAEDSGGSGGSDGSKSDSGGDSSSSSDSGSGSDSGSKKSETSTSSASSSSSSSSSD